MKKYLLKSLLFNDLFMFVYFFTVFLSFCPVNLFLGQIGILLDYISVIGAIMILVFYFFNKKYSKFTIIFVLFLILLFFSTYISETANIGYFFKLYYRILSVVLFIDWGIKINTQGLIKSLFYSLYLLVLINFVTIICFPNGLYEGKYANNWFLGYDNVHIFWYLPTLLVGLIKDKINNKEISVNTIISFCVITPSVFICFSANSVVAYCVFVICFIMYKFFNIKKYISAKTFFIIFWVLFFSIVILRLQNNFSWLIVDVLHKDLTFTNRTIIWDNVMKYISEGFVFGYGVEEGVVMAQKLGSLNFAHAHNTVLDIFYKGGIFSIIVFLYLLKITVFNLNRLKENYLSRIMSITLFSVFIMMIFEARQETIGLYIILILSFYVEQIVNSCEIDFDREEKSDKKYI